MLMDEKGDKEGRREGAGREGGKREGGGREGGGGGEKERGKEEGVCVYTSQHTKTYIIQQNKYLHSHDVPPTKW